MTSLLTGSQVGLVTGAVLAIALVVAALFAMRHLRRRRERLRGKREDDPAIASDRAFNRLAMARTEADLLERQGAEVTPARQLIRLSESEFGARHFDRAYELAQSAHNTLVAARKGPRAAAPTQPAAAASLTPAPVPIVAANPMPAVVPSGGTLPGPAMAKVPKNRVESHFELGLLERDLEASKRDPSRESSAKKGEALRAEAQAAYDRADYSEAFRLALKGRREVGGKVETLAPGPARAPIRSAAETPSTLPGVNPADVAESVAGADRCPQCGHPTQPSDAFCRGCGTPRASASCPKCGAARLPADSFCGVCGQKYG